MRLNLLFIVLSLISCNSAMTPIYEKPKFDVQITKNLDILNDNFIFDNIEYLKVIDTLIVAKSKTDINDFRFHLFNKYTGKYISSFGSVGKAKGELLDPFSLISSNDYKIYAAGATQKKIVKFDILQIINRDSNSYFEEIVLPAVINTRDLININGDNYLLSALGEKSRFSIIDENMKTIDFYNEYPVVLEKDKSNHQLINDYFFYSSLLKIRPDGKKFVNSTYCGLILEIFDINDDNKITRSSIKYFYEPTYDKTGYIKSGESIIGSNVIATSDKYIYMLMNGTKVDVITNILSVFDWKGNPIKQYVTNDRISNVTIDEKENYAYCAAISDLGVPYLVRFEL